MGMIDREKVIKGLEHCDFGVSGACYEKECPYYQSHDCTDELKNDILALLKEQEAVPVYEDKINKCECGETVCRDWHPKFCGFCGRELLWY